MPLARDGALWSLVGRRVFGGSVAGFAVLGLVAGLMAMRSGTPVTVGPLAFEGWHAAAAVTAMMAVAGGLFGAVWLIIFKALTHASRS